jgi:hypothetical protein
LLQKRSHRGGDVLGLDLVKQRGVVKLEKGVHAVYLVN